MFKARLYTVLMLFVLVLAVFAGTRVVSAASSGAGAQVSIRALQSAYSADQQVMVEVSISNPTARPVKVLRWFTPAGDVEEPLFAISQAGNAVAYTGAIYKRPAASAADYVTLKAGESLVRVVDLAASYDFSAGGDYTVRYDVKSFQLHSQGNGLWKSADRLASGDINIQVAGRAPALQSAIQPLGVTGSTSFTSCTTTQQNDLKAARTQASTYSIDALAYLNSNKTGSRYTTWFGIFDTGRYATAKSHFGAITGAMDTAAVSFDCKCKKAYYAYVYPNQPYKIYLCKVFWTAPLTGTDSKAGTLIHEMSHFTVVAGTDDFVYGQAGAKNLAITNPNNAVFNADNHEYFAENTPALP
jgi:peptidyl-Lys metalloendopeptidase